MSRGRIKSITALYAVSVAAALLFGQAVQATSVVITEFDFTLTLSAVRLEDGSDASPTDYLPDELVSAGEHSRNFSAGVASGTGSVAATFNGQPVDDTQPLLLNDTVRTILTTESMTSGPGGVGQRNQFADIFFAFSNESAQDLTFVFDWVAKWDIETINSVAGDQAVGRVGTLITIATGGLETEIELFP